MIDCALTRYQEGRFIDVALSVLEKQEDSRDLAIQVWFYPRCIPIAHKRSAILLRNLLKYVIRITLQDCKKRPLVAVSPTELCKILPMIMFACRLDISWLINDVVSDGK